MISVDPVDRFLIVLVSLTTGFYIVEKVGLWFWRHMIHTQAEAKGCVRPSVRPRTSQSDCRILCQPVASGVVLVAGVTSAMRHARAMARRSAGESPPISAPVWKQLGSICWLCFGRWTEWI